MNPIEKQFLEWSSGIGFELEFWTSWLTTKGREWPEDFAIRLDPASPLQGDLTRLVKELRQPSVNIIDVGAGPITMLGKHLDGVEIRITATDPLAPAYDEILRANGVAPPVQTQFATAEDLSLFVSPSSFDIAHCRNALDHSFDPIRGINEMLRCVRVGGIVALRHNVNEAETENYSGFHQFNFDLIDGNFVIWNRSSRFEVAAVLHVPVTIRATKGDNFLVVDIYKLAEFADVAEPGRFRQRASELARGTIGTFLTVALRQRGIQMS
jgi:SAM-dependent methyltransferase